MAGSWTTTSPSAAATAPPWRRAWCPTRRPGRARIALAAGLLQSRSAHPDRFNATVLHELAHLRARDVGLTYATVALWRVFAVAVLLPYLARAVELVVRGGLVRTGGYEDVVLASACPSTFGRWGCACSRRFWSTERIQLAEAPEYDVVADARRGGGDGYGHRVILRVLVVLEGGAGGYRRPTRSPNASSASSDTTSCTAP
jgi:hypothetical protein